MPPSNTRPTLVNTNPSDNTDNPFPPEPPRPGVTTRPDPARTVAAMRGSWLSRDVKEAIISGAARYGSDGEGTGGMPGYLEMCAANYPKEYMGLLARLVPLQHRDHHAANPSINIGSVNIHPVAADHYLTADEMRRMATPIVEHPAHEPELDFNTPAATPPDDEEPPPAAA